MKDIYQRLRDLIADTTDAASPKPTPKISVTGSAGGGTKSDAEKADEDRLYRLRKLTSSGTEREEEARQLGLTEGSSEWSKFMYPDSPQVDPQDAYKPPTADTIAPFVSDVMNAASGVIDTAVTGLGYMGGAAPFKLAKKAVDLISPDTGKTIDKVTEPVEDIMEYKPLDKAAEKVLGVASHPLARALTGQEAGGTEHEVVSSLIQQLAFIVGAPAASKIVKTAKQYRAVSDLRDALNVDKGQVIRLAELEETLDKMRNSGWNATQLDDYYFKEYRRITGRDIAPKPESPKITSKDLGPSPGVEPTFHKVSPPDPRDLFGGKATRVLPEAQLDTPSTAAGSPSGGGVITTTPTEAGILKVTRTETPGRPAAPTRLPQGVYTTPKHHALAVYAAGRGGSTHELTVNPKANVRKVVLKPTATLTDVGAQSETGVSVGMALLAEMKSTAELLRLTDMTVDELREEGVSKYPGEDWNKYDTAISIIDAFAGLEARKQGIDAAYGVREDGTVDEYVGFTDNAFEETAGVRKRLEMVEARVMNPFTGKMVDVPDSPDVQRMDALAKATGMVMGGKAVQSLIDLVKNLSDRALGGEKLDAGEEAVVKYWDEEIRDKYKQVYNPLTREWGSLKDVTDFWNKTKEEWTQKYLEEYKTRHPMPQKEALKEWFTKGNRYAETATQNALMDAKEKANEEEGENTLPQYDYSQMTAEEFTKLVDLWRGKIQPTEINRLAQLYAQWSDTYKRGDLVMVGKLEDRICEHVRDLLMAVGGMPSVGAVSIDTNVYKQLFAVPPNHKDMLAFMRNPNVKTLQRLVNEMLLVTTAFSTPAANNIRPFNLVSYLSLISFRFSGTANKYQLDLLDYYINVIGDKLRQYTYDALTFPELFEKHSGDIWRYKRGKQIGTPANTSLPDWEFVDTQLEAADESTRHDNYAVGDAARTSMKVFRRRELQPTFPTTKRLKQISNELGTKLGLTLAEVADEDTAGTGLTTATKVGITTGQLQHGQVDPYVYYETLTHELIHGVVGRLKTDIVIYRRQFWKALKETYGDAVAKKYWENTVDKSNTLQQTLDERRIFEHLIPIIERIYNTPWDQVHLVSPTGSVYGLPLSQSAEFSEMLRWAVEWVLYAKSPEITRMVKDDPILREVIWKPANMIWESGWGKYIAPVMLSRFELERATAQHAERMKDVPPFFPEGEIYNETAFLSAVQSATPGQYGGSAAPKNLQFQPATSTWQKDAADIVTVTKSKVKIQKGPMTVLFRKKAARGKRFIIRGAHYIQTNPDFFNIIPRVIGHLEEMELNIAAEIEKNMQLDPANYADFGNAGLFQARGISKEVFQEHMRMVVQDMRDLRNVVKNARTGSQQMAGRGILARIIGGITGIMEPLYRLSREGFRFFLDFVPNIVRSGVTGFPDLMPKESAMAFEWVDAARSLAIEIKLAIEKAWEQIPASWRKLLYNMLENTEYNEWVIANDGEMPFDRPQFQEFNERIKKEVLNSTSTRSLLDMANADPDVFAKLAGLEFAFFEMMKFRDQYEWFVLKNGIITEEQAEFRRKRKGPYMRRINLQAEIHRMKERGFIEEAEEVFRREVGGVYSGANLNSSLGQQQKAKGGWIQDAVLAMASEVEEGTLAFAKRAAMRALAGNSNILYKPAKDEKRPEGWEVVDGRMSLEYDGWYIHPKGIELMAMFDYNGMNKRAEWLMSIILKPMRVLITHLNFPAAYILNWLYNHTVAYNNANLSVASVKTWKMELQYLSDFVQELTDIHKKDFTTLPETPGRIRDAVNHGILKTYHGHDPELRKLLEAGRVYLSAQTGQPFPETKIMTALKVVSPKIAKVVNAAKDLGNGAKDLYTFIDQFYKYFCYRVNVEQGVDKIKAKRLALDAVVNPARAGLLPRWATHVSTAVFGPWFVEAIPALMRSYARNPAGLVNDVIMTKAISAIISLGLAGGDGISKDTFFPSDKGDVFSMMGARESGYRVIGGESGKAIVSNHYGITSPAFMLWEFIEDPKRLIHIFSKQHPMNSFEEMVDNRDQRGKPLYDTRRLDNDAGRRNVNNFLVRYGLQRWSGGILAKVMRHGKHAWDGKNKFNTEFDLTKAMIDIIFGIKVYEIENLAGSKEQQLKALDKRISDQYDLADDMNDPEYRMRNEVSEADARDEARSAVKRAEELKLLRDEYAKYPVK